MQAVALNSPEVCPQPIDERLRPFTRQISENVICTDGIAEIARGHVAYSYFQPNNPIDDVPIIISPGIVGIKPAYDTFGLACAEAGRKTATIRPMRRHHLSSAAHPDHLLHPLKLPSQAIWAVMRDIRDIYGDEQFDVFAHSMGGPTIMGVADKKPRYIRNINLVGSAGLDGQSTLSLGSKLPAAAKEILPAILKLELDRQKAVKHILHYAFQNPLRTGAEAIAVSRSNITESIERARENGIKIARLQFKSDPFFPTGNISEESKLAVDLYLEFHDPEAGHLAPLLQPEEIATTNHQMMTAMLMAA